MKKIYLKPEIEVCNSYSLNSSICNISQDGWAETKRKEYVEFEKNYEKKSNDNWGNVW